MASYKHSSGFFDVGDDGYNFSNEVYADYDPQIPTGWTWEPIGETVIQIHNVDGHSNIVQLSDSAGISEESIGDQDSGTIELWVRVQLGAYLYIKGCDDAVGTVRFQMRTNGTNFQADNGDGAAGSSWTNLTAVANNTWYHVSIRFRGAAAAAYQGLNNNEFEVWIDGTEYTPYGYLNDGDNINILYLYVSNDVAPSYGQFDAIAFDWDATYTIGDNKDLIVDTAITSTDVYSCKITTETMDYPKAEVILQEDVLLPKGSIFQVTDNYSVDNQTSSDIIFEGMVMGKGDNYPKQFYIESRAREMDSQRPSATSSGRSDQVLSDQITNECDYIAAGTLDAGSAMGDRVYAGDKTLRTSWKKLAFFEGCSWHLKEPVANTSIALDFNVGDDDTGVNITSTSNIWDVKRYAGNILYTKVEVLGGVDTDGSIATGSATSNANMLANYGTNTYKYRDATLTTDALCATAATNILGVLDNDPILVEFKYQIASVGMLQVGQTITFSYDLEGVDEIPSGQYIITKSIYDSVSGVGQVYLSSEITYTFKNLTFDDILPQENSQLITQIAANETTQHDREITPSWLYPYNGDDSGTNTVWWNNGIMYFGRTALDNGHWVNIEFKLPSDYVAGQDLTLKWTWKSSATNQEQIDYRMYSFYYRDEIAYTSATDTGALTDTAPGNANTWNELSATISGTNVQASDGIYIKLLMQDASNANDSVHLGYVSLIVPVNTRD